MGKKKRTNAHDVLDVETGLGSSGEVVRTNQRRTVAHGLTIEQQKEFLQINCKHASVNSYDTCQWEVGG